MNHHLACIMCEKKDCKKLFKLLPPNFGESMKAKAKIVCLDCLKSIDKKKFQDMEKIILQKEFCSFHNEQKSAYIRDNNDKWQKYCFSCEKEKWEKGLQRLEINSLSVAKYFYENWGLADPVIMQRLIYFAYLEILREQKIVLFEEKFQAWPGGPVLESVIYPMYEHCEELENFFEKVEGLDNQIVIQYLDKIAKKYSKLESFRIYQESRNELWEEARQDLVSEEESQTIEERNIFAFIEKSKKQVTFYLSQ
ncbi:type II toxin-antitoxin system antitoxin SocA domain-containing protein [endosymbiont GvMRE of Glomus versiforme]|uniref:type II toxin-antitoxin system antitoxin SocA domain-containing protein n=1 Tax=endosymbiont GvMRE of Glomus versiforme TaxID=2039283 RepID=UPI000ECFD035|nr:type II toxin-antitoxin system antitoxin SocA domain-containing protein [endosymbiont GvMRE of Glomus versiforme]RHZ36086.1 hypothetical protein GvMRE_Ic3g120 [endosymbiont GvMRE of Glomus versiforme]RHZ36826.1 hypothetical protein GvMRE_I2g167 [endosymbiont GvMRE of Glomus versiforme]